MTSSEQPETEAKRPRDISLRCVRCDDSSSATTKMLKFELTSVIFICVIMASTVLHTSEAIEWLGLSNDKRQLTWNHSASADCARTKSLGLMRDQRLICQRNPDLMPSVAQAARDSVDVCQELFADRRWNCSTVHLAPNYLPDLASNSREQAFVQALSSATLVHAVAKACSSGQSSKCGCGPIPNDPPPTPPPGSHHHQQHSPGSQQAGPSQFKWGGCADDLRFGLVFGKWFTDMPSTNGRRGISRRAVINAHNNAVGRKIVADSLSTHCKCHGVSGSCTIKTCYRALPVDLRPTVGAALKSRYAVAVHVNDQTGPPGPGGIQSYLPPEPYSIRPSSTSSTSSSASGAASRSKQQSRTRKNKGGQKQSTRNPTREPVSGPSDSQSDWPGSTRGGQSQRGGGRRSTTDRVEAMLANKSVRDDDLIYFTISPDYCLPDAALGSIGTKDRACDKDSTGSGGCRTMCCGRGYKTETVEVRQRCDCKYYWCCYVKCKTCTKTVEIHRCR